jgi:hypothetical protein
MFVPLVSWIDIGIKAQGILPYLGMVITNTIIAFKTKKIESPPLGKRLLFSEDSLFLHLSPLAPLLPFAIYCEFYGAFTNRRAYVLFRPASTTMYVPGKQAQSGPVRKRVSTAL